MKPSLEQSPQPLRVLLVDRRVDRSRALATALEAEGHTVLTAPRDRVDLLECVEETAPDVIVIDTAAPDRDMLEDTRRIGAEHPRPIIMFLEESDRLSMQAAIRAGVAAYVVKGASSERVRDILDVAVTRFEEFQSLKSELAQARNTLADRKVVERAKGILMTRRGIDEAEAYRFLRKLAMNRNVRLVEVARNVIDVADLI